MANPNLNIPFCSFIGWPMLLFEKSAGAELDKLNNDFIQIKSTFNFQMPLIITSKSNGIF